MEDGGTIFHQDWMMDAASKGQWSKVEVTVAGTMIAELPYMIIRKFGTRTIGMPYYTRVLGPVLRLPPSKQSRQLENATVLIRQLIDKLPPHDRFKQRLRPDQDYSVAFALSDFVVTAPHTFLITPDRPPANVMASMKGTQRRNIASTFDRLAVRQHVDLDQFISLAHIQVRGERSRYRFDLIEAMFAAALKHDQAAIISVYDESNQNMATTIILYDTKVAYFWLTARRIIPGNRAYSRLIWEAYQFAFKRGLTLDLDGFPSTNGARYLAEFGGTPVPRNEVVSENIRFRTLKLIHDISSFLGSKFAL